MSNIIYEIDNLIEETKKASYINTVKRIYREKGAKGVGHIIDYTAQKIGKVFKPNAGGVSSSYSRAFGERNTHHRKIFDDQHDILTRRKKIKEHENTLKSHNEELKSAKTDADRNRIRRNITNTNNDLTTARQGLKDKELELDNYRRRHNIPVDLNRDRKRERLKNSMIRRAIGYGTMAGIAGGGIVGGVAINNSLNKKSTDNQQIKDSTEAAVKTVAPNTKKSLSDKVTGLFKSKPEK